jgi:hypothetical protein
VGSRRENGRNVASAASRAREGRSFSIHWRGIAITYNNTLAAEKQFQESIMAAGVSPEEHIRAAFDAFFTVQSHIMKPGDDDISISSFITRFMDKQSDGDFVRRLVRNVLSHLRKMGK